MQKPVILIWHTPASWKFRWSQSVAARNAVGMSHVDCTRGKMLLLMASLNPQLDRWTLCSYYWKDKKKGKKEPSQQPSRGLGLWGWCMELEVRPLGYKNEPGNPFSLKIKYNYVCVCVCVVVCPKSEKSKNKTARKTIYYRKWELAEEHYPRYNWEFKQILFIRLNLIKNLIPVPASLLFFFFFFSYYLTSKLYYLKRSL